MGFRPSLQRPRRSIRSGCSRQSGGRPVVLAAGRPLRAADGPSSVRLGAVLPNRGVGVQWGQDAPGGPSDGVGGLPNHAQVSPGPAGDVGEAVAAGVHALRGGHHVRDALGLDLAPAAAGGVGRQVADVPGWAGSRPCRRRDCWRSSSPSAYDGPDRDSGVAVAAVAGRLARPGGLRRAAAARGEPLGTGRWAVRSGAARGAESADRCLVGAGRPRWSPTCGTATRIARPGATRRLARGPSPPRVRPAPLCASSCTRAATCRDAALLPSARFMRRMQLSRKSDAHARGVCPSPVSNSQTSPNVSMSG